MKILTIATLKEPYPFGRLGSRMASTERDYVVLFEENGDEVELDLLDGRVDVAAVLEMYSATCVRVQVGGTRWRLLEARPNGRSTAKFLSGAIHKVRITRATASLSNAPTYWQNLGRLLHAQKIYKGAAQGALEGIFAAGNVLQLQDTMVPGMQDVRGGFWVHWMYPILAATMLTYLAAGTCRSFHLIGTAGSGKSAFGILWLYYLAQIGEKVLFRAKDEKSWVFFDFSGDDHVVLHAESQAAFTDQVDDKTWLIVDGASQKPIIHPGPILQCVLDKKTNHHEFAKGGMYLFMAAWTYEDCATCARALGLQIGDLAKRFYYCGGVPRLLFDPKLGPEELKTMMDDTFEGISNVEEFSHMLKHPDSSNHLSDKLFHYRYPEKFLDPAVAGRAPTSREVINASDYVLFKADELFNLHGEDQLDRWLRESASYPDQAGWRGKRFEACAHRRFVRGGTFRIRRLRDGFSESATIRPAKVHTIYDWQLHPGAAANLLNVADLPKQPLSSLGSNEYVKALIATQRSWDSFRAEREGDKVVVQIYQMTVSLRHSTIWGGIEELMKTLDKILMKAWGPQIAISYQLVFVVPADKFSVFPQQQYLTRDGKGVYKRMPPQSKLVEQYVLEIVV